MDFHALQNKLFELDPTDPREDFAKMQQIAQSGAPSSKPAEPTKDYLRETAEVTEGSLELDRDYSVSDFAALAGVKLDEGGKWDAFKHGMSNYNKLSAVNTSVDSIKQSKKEKDIEKSFVDRRMKLDKERKKTKKEDQSEIAALEARVTYLEGVIEQLLEGNKQTPSLKPRDPSAQYMNDLRKSGAMGAHKDKKKDAKAGKVKHKGKAYESLKDELWAKLQEAESKRK